MKNRIPRALFLLSLGLSAVALAEPDKKGCTDHPLFPTRMPDYFIVDCKTAEFDAYDFFIPKAQKNRQEGRYTYIAYQIGQGKAEQSGVSVVRNYENALTKIGGKLAASDPQRWVNGNVIIDGKEVWAQAEKGNGKIWLRIVEKQAMKQHIVADAVATELANAYGIAAARLKGYGVGPLAPVAGNDDEGGRARNRRVDLVKAP